MIHRARLLQILVFAMAATSAVSSPSGPSGPSGRGVSLSAVRDATLVEDANGSSGNGSGPVLIGGRTNQGANALRRVLLHFDVGAHVPSTAHITSVTLILNSSGNNQGADTFDLHRVLGDWGEGGSVADGGPGVPAAPGDPTWLHRFHNPAAPASSPAWNRPGGDFVARSSASAELFAPGYYSWSSQRMVRDVQSWVSGEAPESGWVLIGNEDSPGSSRRFESRESSEVARRPLLIVEYRAHGIDQDSDD
jgi:hypothetical protein